MAADATGSERSSRFVYVGTYTERPHGTAIDMRRGDETGRHGELHAAGERVLNALRHRRGGDEHHAEPGLLVEPRGEHAG